MPKRKRSKSSSSSRETGETSEPRSGGTIPSRSRSGSRRRTRSRSGHSGGSSSEPILPAAPAGRQLGRAAPRGGRRPAAGAEPRTAADTDYGRRATGGAGRNRDTGVVQWQDWRRSHQKDLIQRFDYEGDDSTPALRDFRDIPLDYQGATTAWRRRGWEPQDRDDTDDSATMDESTREAQRTTIQEIRAGFGPTQLSDIPKTYTRARAQFARMYWERLTPAEQEGLNPRTGYAPGRNPNEMDYEPTPRVAADTYSPMSPDSPAYEPPGFFQPPTPRPAKRRNPRRAATVKGQEDADRRAKIAKVQDSYLDSSAAMVPSPARDPSPRPPLGPHPDDESDYRRSLFQDEKSPGVPAVPVLGAPPKRPKPAGDSSGPEPLDTSDPGGDVWPPNAPSYDISSPAISSRRASASRSSSHSGRSNQRSRSREVQSDPPYSVIDSDPPETPPARRFARGAEDPQTGAPHGQTEQQITDPSFHTEYSRFEQSQAIIQNRREQRERMEEANRIELDRQRREFARRDEDLRRRFKPEPDAVPRVPPDTVPRTRPPGPGPPSDLPGPRPEAATPLPGSPPKRRQPAPAPEPAPRRKRKPPPPAPPKLAKRKPPPPAKRKARPASPAPFPGRAAIIPPGPGRAGSPVRGRPGYRYARGRAGFRAAVAPGRGAPRAKPPPPPPAVVAARRGGRGGRGAIWAAYMAGRGGRGGRGRGGAPPPPAGGGRGRGRGRGRGIPPPPAAPAAPPAAPAAPPAAPAVAIAQAQYKRQQRRSIHRIPVHQRLAAMHIPVRTKKALTLTSEAPGHFRVKLHKKTRGVSAQVSRLLKRASKYLLVNGRKLNKKQALHVIVGLLEKMAPVDIKLVA